MTCMSWDVQVRPCLDSWVSGATLSCRMGHIRRAQSRCARSRAGQRQAGRHLLAVIDWPDAVTLLRRSENGHRTCAERRLDRRQLVRRRNGSGQADSSHRVWPDSINSLIIERVACLLMEKPVPDEGVPFPRYPRCSCGVTLPCSQHLLPRFLSLLFFLGQVK
jgi:hypothetical protein